HQAIRLPPPMSALGQKQTFAPHQPMSALPPIATAIADFRTSHVRFTPESGHVRCKVRCLLRAKSGHSANDLKDCRLSTQPRARKSRSRRATAIVEMLQTKIKSTTVAAPKSTTRPKRWRS